MKKFEIFIKKEFTNIKHEYIIIIVKGIRKNPEGGKQNDETGIRRSREWRYEMKYYIRAINTETKKSMIMETPVFTNRKKAEAWAEEFSKVMTTVGRAEVVRQDEK